MNKKVKLKVVLLNNCCHAIPVDSALLDPETEIQCSGNRKKVTEFVKHWNKEFENLEAKQKTPKEPEQSKEPKEPKEKNKG